MSGADPLSSSPPFPALLKPRPIDPPATYPDSLPSLCPPCTGIEKEPSVTITMEHPWPKDDILFITDISFNVQLYCGQPLDGSNMCGAITGPSCALCRAMHGCSLQMTMWNNSPKEAEALSSRVIGLNGLDVDERGRVRVHVEIQKVCIRCIALVRQIVS